MSLIRDIFEAIAEHVTPETAGIMRTTNRVIRDAINVEWEDTLSIIPDSERKDPLDQKEIMSQIPQAVPIPFLNYGDIRHITRYVKSMYGEACTLLTPEVFEKLEGQKANILYFYPGQVAKVVDNIFLMEFFGNQFTNQVVAKMVGELISKKKAPRSKLSYDYLLKNANLKNGYFTLTPVEYNHVDTIEVNGELESTWLSVTVTAMAPCPSTIAFVFLKNERVTLTKRSTMLNHLV